MSKEINFGCKILRVLNFANLVQIHEIKCLLWIKVTTAVPTNLHMENISKSNFAYVQSIFYLQRLFSGRMMFVNVLKENDDFMANSYIDR